MSVDVQIKKIFSTFRGVGEETGVVVWGEGVVVGQEVREGGGEVRVTVERVVVDGVVGDGEEGFFFFFFLKYIFYIFF